MKKSVKALVLTGFVLALALAGCGAGGEPVPAWPADVPTESDLGPSPDWVAQLPQAESAGQLLVVAQIEGSTAWVSLHEKDGDGVWQMRMSTPGFLGKAGLGKEKEGDAKTPAGVFGFNAAFGIAEDPGCAIPYTQVQENHYWSGDDREGMHYNEMVDLRDCPGLDTSVSEHLLDCAREYRYCLNIDYNKEGTPGRGSAIFLHCLGDRKPFTRGCVAIPEDRMLTVMRRVRPDCVVVIDSLEKLGGSF